MECKPYCKECRDEIIGEIYGEGRCTDCWIAFLEAEVELWIKRKSPDNSKEALLKENEKLKEQLQAKERNISRLNIEAQRWFDIAMDQLHK